MNLNIDFKIIEPITLDLVRIFKPIKIQQPITPVSISQKQTSASKHDRLQNWGQWLDLEEELLTHKTRSVSKIFMNENYVETYPES